MEKEKHYIITAYTENQVGLLSTVAGLFTRRSINIDALRVFPSGIPGVHKFVVKTTTSEAKVRAIVVNMEKKVDVIKTFFYVDNEDFNQELKLVQEYIESREKEINN